MSPTSLSTWHSQPGMCMSCQMHLMEQLDHWGKLCVLQCRQVGSHAGRSDEGSAAGALLKGDADAILKAAARQLREKSPKTRSGIFLALRELVLVLPDACTAESMALLLPAILQALTVCLPSSPRSCLCQIPGWRCHVFMGGIDKVLMSD